MKRFLTLLAIAALPFTALAIATPASAHEFTAGDLVIHHPYLYETPPLAMSAGGYMTIENNGDAPDQLIGVEAEGFKAALHESIEKDGMHMMQPIDSLEIPAHGSAELAPGGYHVMITGLDGKTFAAGTMVPGVLIFQTAGRVPVQFLVQKRKEGEGDMGDMKGMEMPKTGN
jgi:periplasmic copper chaperone A